MPKDPPPPDTPIANGRYVLGEMIGEGGFARVFRARDRELMVTRAVKILVGPEADRKRLRPRLKAEARAMARVGHPNVLKVYDVGADDQFDYVVMDLAEGGTLGDRVEREGALPPREAIAYIVQVLAALDAAHHAGVIHRDVKPNNVLLDKNGAALLGDFGIALLDWTELPRGTRTGAAMGTLAYMAPEQRLDARNVGPEADLYAVGATLFHLVTAATPFDLFMAGADSPRWEGVPAELRDVLVRAVRYEPRERFQTAREMAAALTPLLDADLPSFQGPAEKPDRPPTLVAGTARARTLLEAPPLALRDALDATTFTQQDTLVSDEVVASMGTRPLRRESPLLAGVLVAAVGACTLLAIAVGTALPHDRPPDPGAPPPPPVPAAPALPIGSWAGKAGPHVVQLELGGDPAHPEGELTVWDEDVITPLVVRGEYDAVTRALVLDVQPAQADGHWAGVVADDETWRGTHREGEAALSFAIQRQK